MTSERSEIEALADEVMSIGTDSDYAWGLRASVARKLRELARRLQPARVPDGWKLVPVDGLCPDCRYAYNSPACLESHAAAPAAEGGMAWESPFGSCVCEGQNECPGCNPNEAIKMAAEIATADERAKHPPCMECGATTAKEAETMCHCSGDKDDCHGCQLWPDVEATPAPESREAETLDESLERVIRDISDEIEPEAGQREGNIADAWARVCVELHELAPDWMVRERGQEWDAGEAAALAVRRLAEKPGDGGREGVEALEICRELVKWCDENNQGASLWFVERARRLASAQQAGNPWDSIISEIQRRAESEGADERGSDFTVTISIGEYRKAMRAGSRGEGCDA